VIDMQGREKLGQTEVLEAAGKKEGLAINVPDRLWQSLHSS
jgi:hypothetical protein